MGRFQATCGNPAHQGDLCRLTRTSAPSARGGQRAGPQGRPLGLLAAWLAAAPTAATAEDHKAAVAFLDIEERRSAREELMKLPSGRSLAELERPQRTGESPEPLGMP